MKREKGMELKYINQLGAKKQDGFLGTKDFLRWKIITFGPRNTKYLEDIGNTVCYIYKESYDKFMYLYPIISSVKYKYYYGFVFFNVNVTIFLVFLKLIM